MGEKFYNKRQKVLVVAVRLPVPVGIFFQVFQLHDSYSFCIAKANLGWNIREIAYIFICKFLMGD